MDTPSEANARFTAFVSEVRGSNHLWALRNDSGYAQWSNEGEVCFPVWSQRHMAEQAAARSLPGYRAEELGIHFFRDSILPALRDREV